MYRCGESVPDSRIDTAVYPHVSTSIIALLNATALCGLHHRFQGIWTLFGDMGRLRNFAQTVHNFATTHVEKPEVPAVADGEDGYAKSTKIALLLLKEETNKPLRRLEDYLNEMLGSLDIFGLESSPDH